MAGNAVTIENTNKYTEKFQQCYAAVKQRFNLMSMFHQNASNITSQPETKMVKPKLAMVLPREKVTAYDGFEKGAKHLVALYQQEHQHATLSDKIWNVIFGNENTAKEVYPVDMSPTIVDVGGIEAIQTNAPKAVIG